MYIVQSMISKSPEQNGEKYCYEQFPSDCSQMQVLLIEFYCAITASVYFKDHFGFKAQSCTHWGERQSMLDGLHGKKAIPLKCADQQGCVSAPW